MMILLLQGKLLDVARVTNAYQKAKNLEQEDIVTLTRRVVRAQKTLRRAVMNHMVRGAIMAILISSIMDGATLAEAMDLVMYFNKK